MDRHHRLLLETLGSPNQLCHEDLPGISLVHRARLQSPLSGVTPLTSELLQIIFTEDISVVFTGDQARHQPKRSQVLEIWSPALGWRNSVS